MKGTKSHAQIAIQQVFTESFTGCVTVIYKPPNVTSSPECLLLQNILVDAVVAEIFSCQNMMDPA